MLVADGMGAAADAIDAHRSGVYAAHDISLDLARQSQVRGTQIRDLLVPTQFGVIVERASLPQRDHDRPFLCGISSPLTLAAPHHKRRGRGTSITSPPLT
jgi:hypothetical protein